jgi:hypothetical protein
MIGFAAISKVFTAIKIVGRIQRAVKEGKDVADAAARIEAKYGELPDDVQDAWRELREFIEAVKDIV